MIDFGELLTILLGTLSFLLLVRCAQFEDQVNELKRKIKGD